MPETCEHQWGGSQNDGYTCGLCNAAGHYDPDQGAVVADEAPAAAPAPAPAVE